MAYSELVKNFGGVRDYMREFYVYGFRSREEFKIKSARSYDDERRRIQSWLGDYMCFRQTSEGKNVFLSIDSRISRHNPFYKAWKAKSFTDGDITIHFLIFDILHSSETVMSLNEITAWIDSRLSCFENPRTFDSSTVRKKLKEYVNEGILTAEKRGKTVFYRRAEDTSLTCTDVLDFFSEVSPCGAVGSFLLDKMPEHYDCFAFKHHYITQALDSGILYDLLENMHSKQSVIIKTLSHRKEKASVHEVVPLQIFVSVQNGRQYLMAYNPLFKRIRTYRLDNIVSVQAGVICENFDTYRQILDRIQKHIWGVSTGGGAHRLEHVEFTVRYGDDEEHIHQRLEREKRCGTVERIDSHTSRFTADVFSAGEMVPWIRTFICRITRISFSDKKLETQFKNDIENMYRMYGLKEGAAE